MRRSLSIVAAVCGFALGGLAHAAELEPRYSKAYQDCIGRSGGADPAMTDCEDAEAGRQDAALNTMYRNLMGKLTGDAKSDLLNSERAWVAYRDAECAFEGSVDEGGTAERLEYAGCVLGLTYRRVELLRNRLGVERKYGPG